MNPFQSAALACLAFLVISCGHPAVSSDDSRVIDVATAMAKQTTLKASEYFSEIGYIPLETNDECLIGRDPKIRFAGENILITSSTSSYSQAMLFDANGKFIRHIGYRGNDPEGYNSVRCFVDDSRELIYFEGFGSNLVCYGFDGKFTGRIPTHGPSGMGSTFYFLNGDTLIGYRSNPLSGNVFDGITLFNASGKIDSIPSNLPELPPLEVVSMDVLTSTGMYGPVGYEGILFIYGRETASIWMAGATIFWNQDRETYFKEPFNDTIYVIQQNTKIPRLILELGEYRWEAAERMKKDKNKGFYSTQFFENQQILFFRFLTGLFADNVMSYNAVYNKVTGNINIAPFKEGIIDDLTHFLPLQPRAVSSSGVYAGMLDPADILEWFEKQDNNANTHPEVQKLRQLDEEDNPVVVLMK